MNRDYDTNRKRATGGSRRRSAADDRYDPLGSASSWAADARDMYSYGRPERDRSERDRSERDRSHRDRPERDRLERDRSERDRSERDRSERNRSERDRSYRDRSERDRSERERPERERPERDRSAKDPSAKDQQLNHKTKDQQLHQTAKDQRVHTKAKDQQQQLHVQAKDQQPSIKAKAGVHKSSHSPSADRFQDETTAMHALAKEKAKLTKENEDLRAQLKDKSAKLVTLQKRVGGDFDCDDTSCWLPNNPASGLWQGLKNLTGQDPGQEGQTSSSQQKSGQSKASMSHNTAAMEKEIKHWKKRAKDYETAAESLKRENDKLKGKPSGTRDAVGDNSGRLQGSKSQTRLVLPSEKGKGTRWIRKGLIRFIKTATPGMLLSVGPAGANMLKGALQNIAGKAVARVPQISLPSLDVQTLAGQAVAHVSHLTLPSWRVPCTRPHADSITYRSFILEHFMACLEVAVYLYSWMLILWKTTMSGMLYRHRKLLARTRLVRMADLEKCKPSSQGAGAMRMARPLPVAPESAMMAFRLMLMLGSLIAFVECLYQRHIWRQANDYTRVYLVSQTRSGKDPMRPLVVMGGDLALWVDRGQRAVRLALAMTWDGVLVAVLSSDKVHAYVERRWGWLGGGGGPGEKKKEREKEKEREREREREREKEKMSGKDKDKSGGRSDGGGGGGGGGRADRLRRAALAARLAGRLGLGFVAVCFCWSLACFLTELVMGTGRTRW